MEPRERAAAPAAFDAWRVAAEPLQRSLKRLSWPSLGRVGNPMKNAKAAAVLHVRVMEARIEKQSDLVRQMESAGQDSSEQISRLNLLRLALEEMLIHCGLLTPNAKETAHASRTAPLPSGLFRKRK